MIWALYHQGISHQPAIRRGRWVARVRYYAWRTAIPRLAWTNGTRRSRAEESAALYGTDLVFVLGADSCSRCGCAQWATAVVREAALERPGLLGVSARPPVVRATSVAFTPPKGCCRLPHSTRSRRLP